MTKKLRILTILMFLMVLGHQANAQSLQQSQNGTITVRVACNCQIIVEKPNQPLHFNGSGRYQRDQKHLKIISNCAWNLRVVSNKRDNDDDHGPKLDAAHITYTFKNIRGTGKLNNANEKYSLNSSSHNLPGGVGEIEFDVVFELDSNCLIKAKWGYYNTWVDFYILPQ
jgi:hypothetical protein